MLRVGELFLVGLSGPELTLYEQEAIKEFTLRHFIFFKRNLLEKEQIKSLLIKINEISGPGLRALDQEGGPVARLKPPLFPAIKAPFDLANDKDPEAAVAKEAALCARELKAYGFNFNLAPVLDLGGENAPSFLRGRTFGEDASLVAQLGETYIKTFHSYGVYTCAKHFPGLGGVAIDPHQNLPVKNSFSEDDLRPFYQAIAAKVPAIMTTHLIISTFDGVPATFSKQIVRFLREKMGFTGLLLTDDLYMGGVSLPLEEAVLKAVLSGHDLILLCQNFSQTIKIIENFAKEVRNSPSLQNRVKKALVRQESLLNFFASCLGKS
ncbi:glycoside hydrolase family 3 N-terminal domain-containing protein [Thermodesulfatator atlanticus]|uniref:glycoside hydrolase family 3 N-terminal domain-containing protein n=1 Tax=Thermodesulfatator atlanticus TaxID=501497 RepID=UPI0003B55B97|nr:glycoside hydrolase family 3 N-terminal domain-containing protein [Thermodesulfatator atlanticus]